MKQQRQLPNFLFEQEAKAYKLIEAIKIQATKPLKCTYNTVDFKSLANKPDEQNLNHLMKQFLYLSIEPKKPSDHNEVGDISIIRLEANHCEETLDDIVDFVLALEPSPNS